MGFLAGTEIFDFANKITRIAELAVNGGEADIGDIIHLFEALHDLFADGSGGISRPYFCSNSSMTLSTVFSMSSGLTGRFSHAFWKPRTSLRRSKGS